VSGLRDLVFVKLCRWSRLVNPAWDGHFGVAVLLLSMCTFLNVLTIFGLIELLLGVEVLTVIGRRREIGIALACVLALANYLSFRRRSLDECISQESADPHQVRREDLAVAAYVVLSPIVFFLLCLLLAVGNRGPA
jgi:hypothetical protein